MKILLKIIPWGLVVAGAILLALGIVNGDAVQVMRQAVTVCLECIGIG